MDSIEFVWIGDPFMAPANGGVCWPLSPNDSKVFPSFQLEIDQA
jgi:hypothetical protein